MFFEQIDRMIGRDADLILTIRKTDDGTLTVAAHTRMNGVEDEARHYIAPFTASGLRRSWIRVSFPHWPSPQSKRRDS